MSKRGLLFVAIFGALLVSVPFASAHIERAAYWPAPGAQQVDGVNAGGAVPEQRPLFTALDPKPVGDTHVVCQGTVPTVPKALNDKKASKKAKKAARRKYSKAVKKNTSMATLDKSLKQVLPPKAAKKKAKKKKGSKAGKGYTLRPSEPNIQVSRKEGDKLRKFNGKLLKQCKFDSIQAAVNAAGNNDRVVIMPGLYTEQASRSAPTNDPKCDGLEEVNDRGRTGALSYRYQVMCPNDQNLIAVNGRALAAELPPQPPLTNRRGIPDEGACVKCNLQIEGSGVSPDDVIVDAGNIAAGNKGPANPVKDVVFRIDRADGFVARNMNVRHAAEHGFYVIETDGYLLDHFKAFYNEEYGMLGFTSDHGVISDCDAAGSGDSAIYPGAAPDTGEQTVEGTQRYNTEIARCDMHHSAAGYSGTSANAVWIHNNDFYDNANGFTTDVFTAAGHPGFPQDSDLIENNEFYSNNYNPYEPGADIEPTVPMPVGTGMWIAGGNNNIVRNNRFWDNWRRGAMLFAVPNSFVGGCGDPAVPECNPANFDTSFRNQYYGNKMGQAPDGTSQPNGVDFWWDQNGTGPAQNSNNCWFNNTGKSGTTASLTSIPASLPSDCANSPAGAPLGTAEVGELLTCNGAPKVPGGSCPWFTTPPKPAP